MQWGLRSAAAKGYSILLNFDIDRHCGEYTYLEKAAQVAAFNKYEAQVDEHYVFITVSM